MDLIMWLLIALLIIVVATLAFAMIRSKQRSGSVLASPETARRDGDS